MTQARNSTGLKYSHLVAEGLWHITIGREWQSNSFYNPTVGALVDALDQYIEETGDSYIFLESYTVRDDTIDLQLGS